MFSIKKIRLRRVRIVEGEELFSIALKEPGGAVDYCSC